MKKLFRLSLYAFLGLVWSCTDHRIPPGVSCDEFISRITNCISWKLTSRTVNNVEAITACQQNLRLVFPGGKFGQTFTFSSGVDPEFCGSGVGIPNGSGGPYACNNGVITLTKTINFSSGPTYGPITQTLNFLSATSFLLTYTDTKGNAVVETYVCAN